MTKALHTGNEKLAGKFYDQYLTTSVAKNESKQTVDSYWQQPQHGDFSIVAIETEDFREQLRQMWSGDNALLCLIEPLYRLSQTVEEPSESTTEISPFIYAMF